MFTKTTKFFPQLDSAELILALFSAFQVNLCWRTCHVILYVVDRSIFDGLTRQTLYLMSNFVEVRINACVNGSS